MSEIVVTVLVLVALTHTFAVEVDWIGGPNEVWRACGSSCIPTCQHPQTATTTCITLCKNACSCRYGYIRDERTKKCVKGYQCSQNV